MENNIREERLRLITKLLFIFVILVLASEVVYCYVYAPLAIKDPMIVRSSIFRTSGFFLTAKLTRIIVIDISIFALSAIACIIGIINVSKKNIVKICLLFLGCIFLFKSIAPFYPVILSMISKFVHSSFGDILKTHSYLIIYPFFALLPIVICLFATMKKSDVQQNDRKSDKSGFGGFFIIAMIRNISFPINNMVIVIMLILGNFLASGRVDFETLFNNKMLLIAVLLFIVSLIAVIKMFKKHRSFIPTIISAECISIYYSIHKILTACTNAKSYYMQQGYFSSVIYTDIAMVIASILYVIYYAKSSRVKNTFTT